MSQTIEVKVPDIGDFNDVPVIEVMVKPGDTVKAEDSLVTLESDKATMDVPSPAAGIVKEVKVKIGDKVSQGTLVLLLEAGASNGEGSGAKGEASQPAPAPSPVPASSSRLTEVKVPDIGDFKDVPVIEITVKVGDAVKAEDALVTLESDKATMDVPAPVAGVVQAIAVKLGDKVSEGSVILTLAATGAAVSAPAASPAATLDTVAAPEAATAAVASLAAPVATAPAGKAHASPSVRKFARELGVDVAKVAGSGPKGRILHDDVQNYVKGVMAQASGGATATAGASLGGGLDLLPWPKVDFAKFGAIETKPLSRIKKISGQNLARNWVMVPAVTYHEDADITDLEAFRLQVNKENEKSGQKLTMLAFLIKACVKAMQKFPEFNASIDVSGGEPSLVYKKYFHIAFAADTPNGLVVPVVKNADQKGVFEIAAETGELAKKARDGKLGPAEMQGACFTISSLGGIGGTYFAPIVNAPEVAILGVNKSAMKPVWDGKAFEPRLVLPLSLTADHRVIDGAMATRFNVYVAQLLADMRRMML
jgi:pyruvate dehydrogenase E2 component (dihydrolipoamide acetyltransferase)